MKHEEEVGVSEGQSREFFYKYLMCFIKLSGFKLLWPFYITQIIQSFFFLTTAYWTVYFLNLGYSLVQISILPTVMLLTSFALELPTGIIADLKGRKFSVVTSIFLESSAMLLIPFVGLRFEILILLYVFMGIGAAFASGASEAWVVDFLHWHDRPSIIPSYYAFLHSFINIGFIIAPLLASVILFLTKSLNYLWWIEGMAFFCTGVILLLFGKEKRTMALYLDENKKLFFKNILSLFRGKSSFIYMVVIIFFTAIIFGLTSLAWQPFLQDRGVPLSWFGVLFAFSGLLAIGYPTIHKFVLSRIGSRRILQFISIVQVLALGVLIIIPFAGIIILFFIIQNLDSIKLPILQPWIQEHIPSAARSTFGSIVSMVGAAGEGAGYIIAGQLASNFSINAIWLLAAGCGLLIIFLLNVMRRQSK